MSFKTQMHYKDGNLVNTDYPDTDDKSIIIPIASVTGSIDLAIKNFVTGKFDGIIHVSSQERENRKETETPNVIIIKYEITPDEAIPAIQKAVSMFYKD